MTASATISVEIELGWGFHDKTDPYEAPELSSDGRKERAALDWFLDLCDEAGVHVTFDVVGHLLLDSCDGGHDGPHEDEWFDSDPGTDAETDPLFYFPEVTEEIRAADVDHEVCTHTFSHVLCDEVTDEVLDCEIGRARELHDEEVVSLVPPRHREPPRGVLRANDIDVVRLAVDNQPPSNPAARFLWNFTRDHPLHQPEDVGGVVETKTSPFMTLTASHLSRGVSPPHPSFRVVPRRLRQRTHENFLRSGLRAAVERDSHVHYWTHLYNLAHEDQHPPVESLMMSLAQNVNVVPVKMEEMAGEGV